MDDLESRTKGRIEELESALGKIESQTVVAYMAESESGLYQMSMNIHDIIQVTLGRVRK